MPFESESTYGSFMYRQEPVYGYAIVQKPCLVPIGSTSVYMSCYSTTINGSPINDNNEPHYYVNGDFLAEKLRLEEIEAIEVFIVITGLIRDFKYIYGEEISQELISNYCFIYNLHDNR